MAIADMRADALLDEAEKLLQLRQLDGIAELFHRAERSGGDPDCCAAGRWMAAMLRGEFRAARRESDAIRRRWAPDEHRIWQGKDLTGRRVIVRLHGFGDAVPFLRFAPLLHRRTAKVIWEISPAMADLAPCLVGVDKVLAWGADCVAGRDWDLQIEVMEPPYIFRTAPEELPIASKYVQLANATIQRVRREMGAAAATPRVGLVWNSGTWNESRSIPFHSLRSLFEVDGCEFWNLQGGPCRYVDTEPELMPMRDSPACSDGILSFAGVISQLDLIVTVDTLAAHLAGAIGIPAWLMLQHAADWRWMAGRNDSPWYPSLRIFRQPSPGACEHVIRAIAEKLQIWLLQEQKYSA